MANKNFDASVITLTASAEIIEPTAKQLEEVEGIVQSYYQASRPKPVIDGKPRMLFLNAWMVHEGRNENGDAFVKEELERKVSEGLFSPPYAGMIDDDHDFMARGFWYKTTFAFDKKANTWGIFAQGAIWAWRHPELADRLLAEMHRDGKVMVSMSAISESQELTQTYPGFEGKYTVVHHNPVFFTTSTLSVPPGDLEARGNATENPTEGIIDPSETHPEQTVSSEVNMDKEKDTTTQTDTAAEEDNQTASTEEETAEKESESSEETATTSEAESSETESEGSDSEDTSAESTSDDTVVSLPDDIVALKAALEEAKVTIKALLSAKESLEAQVKELSDRLAAFEKADEDKKAEEKFEARMNELPEVVRTSLEEHPERETVLARWRTLPDQEWELVSASLKAVDTGVSFTRRSETSGTLPVGGGSTTDVTERLKSLLRN